MGLFDKPKPQPPARPPPPPPVSAPAPAPVRPPEKTGGLLVGMKVVYVGDEKDLNGMEATVVALGVDVGKPIGLEFGEEISLGHDCDGYGAYGYCWWARRDEVRIKK